MKKLFKNSLSLALAFAVMVCSCVVATPAQTVKAATKGLVSAEKEEIRTSSNTHSFYSSESLENGVANTAITKTFNVDVSSVVCFTLYTSSATSYNVTITDASGHSVSGALSTAYDSSIGYICDSRMTGYALPVGSTTITFTFASQVDFALYVYREDSATAAATTTVTPTISESTMEVAKGCKKTLTVSGVAVASWSSSDSNIATVDNGVVKGKSTGTCNIIAQCTDGQMVTCAVTVVKNKYSQSKLKKSSYSSGVVGQIYNAKYDDKGNLIMKLVVVNNSSNKIVKLSGLKLVGRTADGTKFVSKKFTKKVTIKAGKSKTFTVKVKKSKLKIKSKQDLTTSTFSVDGGKYKYYIYY